MLAAFSNGLTSTDLDMLSAIISICLVYGINRTGQINGKSRRKRKWYYLYGRQTRTSFE